MKRCLIIFAKEPRRARVKTRLQDYLSETQCVNLYKAFLKDTLDLARKIKCDVKILAYESQNKNPRYLKKVAPRFKFYKQKGDDLGERMYNAFRFARDNGASRMVIIGSDSPTLSAHSIKKAFNLLDTTDIVLGPTHDGGYYLIGLKKPCFGLFKGIGWSSQTVFEDTIKNTRRLNKDIALLDKSYDVDDSGALRRLKRDLRRPKNKNVAVWTKKFLHFVT